MPTHPPKRRRKAERDPAEPYVVLLVDRRRAGAEIRVVVEYSRRDHAGRRERRFAASPHYGRARRFKGLRAVRAWLAAFYGDRAGLHVRYRWCPVPVRLAELDLSRPERAGVRPRGATGG